MIDECSVCFEPVRRRSALRRGGDDESLAVWSQRRPRDPQRVRVDQRIGDRPLVDDSAAEISRRDDENDHDD